VTYRKPPAGYRLISVQLSSELVDYLDQQAAARTISRAALIRQLILADRQQATATA
jgi:predicted transcriptional regulator